MLDTSRRKFITGLVSFIAAPAIVKASSLMPIKNIDIDSAGSGYDIDKALKKLAFNSEYGRFSSPWVHAYSYIWTPKDGGILVPISGVINGVDRPTDIR